MRDCAACPKRTTCVLSPFFRSTNEGGRA
jgi:hypothetical protein